MKFTVFDLGNYFLNFQNMTRDDYGNSIRRLLYDIRKSYPTVIVFPFCAVKLANENNRIDIVKQIIRLDENSKNGTVRSIMFRKLV